MAVSTPSLSFSTLTASFRLPPSSALLCPQTLRQRDLFSVSGKNTKQRRLAVSSHYRRRSPKAAVGRNVEAIGVPTSVPVRVAHELLLAGHRYLDVRTPEEFSAGHPSGAINIPYMYRVGSGMVKNQNFLEEVSSHFRKHDEIIVGCQSGKRSIMAATELLTAILPVGFPPGRRTASQRNADVNFVRGIA